ncbi:ABC transporter permease [Curtobacterium sp. MCSS17_015]|uniref:ABC transporter permease n=1 Tax=Curtobacterium sp. MCSS17_015 TaxID=2175666 RepID=UPI000DA78ECF|nr:ABC transporter permease [Curtobacterium sp. MCSS17_015]WIB25613.1 ABC transporter permease [Curtobacterium sp. MCSS17_015]
MSAAQQTDHRGAEQHRHRGKSSLQGKHLGFLRLVRSEWIKFWSIRSTFWCFAVIAVLTIGLATLIGALAEGDAPTTDAANQTIVGMNTISVYLSALVVGVLGVLIISGEYATGQIRSTFTADPGRLGALLAKATVLAVSTFLVSVVATWIGVAVSTALQSAKGVHPDLTDPAVVMPLLGASVYVTLVALLAFGIGLLVRSSAGGIAITLGILLVLPIVLSLVSMLAGIDWLGTAAGYLPDAAGGQLYAYASDAPASGSSGAPATASVEGSSDLNGWSGAGVLLAEVVVVVALAMVVARRRDV